MSEPLARIDNLRLALGGRPVLNGVTADLPRGGITALVGLNGCGKSTLLKTLLGEHPDGGSVRWTAPRPRVGYVPQKLLIDGRLPMSVLDLLALALSKRPAFLGVSDATRGRATALLERVGATGVIDAPLASVSGGELQRVLLGLALEPRPDLLVLDEPAAGVDFRDQARLYDLIRAANAADGVTVLMVTHELGVTREYASRVWCMRSGRIEREGPAAEVLTAETLGTLFGVRP